MQTIQTNNTTVGTGIRGQRVIVDVTNRMSDLARNLRGYLAMAGRFAPLAVLQRLVDLLVAALRAGLAVWCKRHLLMVPAMVGKPADHDGSTTSALSGGSFSRRPGSLG
jgi:hypothetical protein